MSTELKSKPLDFLLKGVDDNRYSLSDFEGKNYLAIIFSCNHCPYVVASEREIINLQSEFGEKGLQIVAINSNSYNQNYPSDSFENMVKRAKEKQFNFPYLDDEDQSVSRAYGAGRTPEIYLYNEDRELVYHGRINDNPKEHSKITRHDFRIAIEELIDGKDISIPHTNALGCSIKYVN